MRVPRYNKQSGFTLLELLIVIAIIGIISTLAYPGMQKQIAQMKVRDAANTLETTLKQAKSDALIYQVDVIVELIEENSKVVGIKLTQASNNNYPQEKYFDKSLSFERNNTQPFKLTLSPKRTISPDGTIGFCSPGVNKYTVKFDKIGNINMSKENTICP